jgi:hypothetical protein
MIFDCILFFVGDGIRILLILDGLFQFFSFIRTSRISFTTSVYHVLDLHSQFELDLFDFDNTEASINLSMVNLQVTPFVHLTVVWIFVGSLSI